MIESMVRIVRAFFRHHGGYDRRGIVTDGVDPLHQYEDVSGGVASDRVKVGASIAYAGEELGASYLKTRNGFGEIVHIQSAVPVRESRPDRRESVEPGVVEDQTRAAHVECGVCRSLDFRFPNER